MLSISKVSNGFGSTKKTTSNTLNRAVIHHWQRNKTTSNTLNKEVLDQWKRKKTTPSLLNNAIIDQWQRFRLTSFSNMATYSLDRSSIQPVKNEQIPCVRFKICKCKNAESNLMATKNTNSSLILQENMLNFGTIRKYVPFWFGEEGKYSSLYNVSPQIGQSDFKRAYHKQIITGCSFCMAAIISLLYIGLKSEGWLIANNESHGQQLESFSRQTRRDVGHPHQEGTFREELYHIIPSE